MNKQEITMLLTEVSATDRRTIGLTDVEVWSAILDDPDIPLAFARHAVITHFKERPGVWLEPGHIYQRWRDYRRDQIAREDEKMRLARQEALDARNVEELGVASLAESINAEPVPLKYFRRSQQQGGNPLIVPCPWCKATVGRVCTNTATRKNTNPHPSRMDALAALNSKEETNA